MGTRIGVYPGTFDPVTLGHIDIIRRGAKLVDQLVIGVTTNPSKSPMFTVAERMAMVARECADIDTRIVVVAFDNIVEADDIACRTIGFNRCAARRSPAAAIESGGIG